MEMRPLRITRITPGEPPPRICESKGLLSPRYVEWLRRLPAGAPRFNGPMPQWAVCVLAVHSGDVDHVGSVRRMEDGGYQMVMWGTDPLHRIWCTFGPPEAAKVADMTPPLDGVRGYPTPREWPPDFTGVIRP